MFFDGDLIQSSLGWGGERQLQIVTARLSSGKKRSVDISFVCESITV